MVLISPINCGIFSQWSQEELEADAMVWFLSLLEGLRGHFQAPKTYHAEEILWSKKAPICDTSSKE